MRFLITVLLSFFVLNSAALAQTDTSSCVPVGEERFLENMILRQVFDHVGVGGLVCGVSNISCQSPCACVYQAFELSDQLTFQSEEKKLQLRDSFVTLHDEYLQCFANTM
jgi:hypothetical protein